jgi:hypothetical protein
MLGWTPWAILQPRCKMVQELWCAMSPAVRGVFCGEGDTEFGHVEMYDGQTASSCPDGT